MTLTQSRPRKRRRGLAIGLAVILALALGGGAIALRQTLHSSLPILDGTLEVTGLDASITIERDSLGIPTIRAASRRDASFALGFLHGQERFFQMDLQRRGAAGELAALVGAAALPADREARVQRFRSRAKRVVAAFDPLAREQVMAYGAGITAALAASRAAPEYALLRIEPEPWQPEDTVLVLLAMFSLLGDPTGSTESAVGLLHDVLPEGLARFLDVQGGSWDAPIDASVLDEPPFPGQATLGAPDGHGKEALELRGSNAWAVAGRHTASGQAILAGDMHLPIQVPNIWYRAVIEVGAADGTTRRLAGITLPGTPALIAGSNGDLAWAFTNSETDAIDLVVLEDDSSGPDMVRTPDGPRRIERHVELLAVHGAASESLVVEETIWGPVIDRDHRGRRRALRWTAHDVEAVNVNLLGMESTRSIEEALALAPTCGIPPQNLILAAKDGRIAWTIAGVLPKRVGFDGRRPTSWADGTHRWDGYIAPGDMPRIVDPPSGRIWSANQRMVGGPALVPLGDGGYALGARAQQIRDALLAIDRATPADMLRIQLDDRALFLARWRILLLETLDGAPADRRRAALRNMVENWGGHAAIESAGYRIVRTFRAVLLDDVFGRLASACFAADRRFSPILFPQREAPVWRLLTTRTTGLLDPRYPSWDACILAAIDTTLARLAPRDSADTRAADTATVQAQLAARTWGERNTTRIRHPLSRGVPQLARWLDMPQRSLPGDSNMPRVQSPGGGASQRMVVSPGHEEDGIFHMPGGQSGHPLSRHYRDGHAAWEEGRPTPFLPGPPVYRLILDARGKEPARVERH